MVPKKAPKKVADVHHDTSLYPTYDKEFEEMSDEELAEHHRRWDKIVKEGKPAPLKG